MYKVLTIGGKEYKLEYTIEASLYDECMDKLMDFFMKVFGRGEEPDFPAGATDEQKEKLQMAFLKDKISGMANIPATALTLFYTGLLEHHGASGDRSVLSKNDAKEIIRAYFNDHKDDGTDNFYDLLMVCLNQMGEDGFFKMTGLEKMIMNQGTQKKTAKKPQDHKKAGGN